MWTPSILYVLFRGLYVICDPSRQVIVCILSCSFFFRCEGVALGPKVSRGLAFCYFKSEAGVLAKGL